VTARHKLVADEIEHVTLEMNYSRRSIRRRGSRRRRRTGAVSVAGYMLAYTLIAATIRCWRRTWRTARRRRRDRCELAARVCRLQGKVEIVGAVGRECFAPRLTVTLRDGRRVAGEYHGRE